jgi:SET domain-containing protein
MAEQGNQGEASMHSFCSELNTADSRHLMELKPFPGKGLGLFANEKILRGTRILAEQVLLATNEDSGCKGILSEFKSLSPSQQDAYFDLHGYTEDLHRRMTAKELGCKWQNIPALHRRVLSIYHANAFEKGVFILRSRMNHSCLPNTITKYNPIYAKRTFHAIYDIDAHGELTTLAAEVVCTSSARPS